MPVIPSDYRPPRLLTNAHLQTIFTLLVRSWPAVEFTTERISTPDNDFLDLDWHRSKRNNVNGLVVMTHGLEGNGRRKYMFGMARHLTAAGWDVCCWSHRMCLGTPNDTPRLYHSGVTDDLHTVLTHGLSEGYENAILLGFSMGGNQTLKYLGEAPDMVPHQVKAAMAISVPVELGDAGVELEQGFNMIYTRYFLRGLKEKIKHKAERFPDACTTDGLDAITTLKQFDDRYTGPFFGFGNAANYYRQASSRQFLKNIRIPTLLLNAKNDPFLPGSCYPVAEAEANPNLYLEMPDNGGHVGFVKLGNGNIFWSEERAARWLAPFAAGS